MVITAIGRRPLTRPACTTIALQGKARESGLFASTRVYPGKAQPVASRAASEPHFELSMISSEVLQKDIFH